MSGDGFRGAKQRGLASQATILVTATAISQVITALIYLVPARLTGPSTYGPVVAAIALGTAAVGYFDFGTNSLWVREVARSAMVPMDLGERVRAKLFLALFMCSTWVVTVLVLTQGSVYWIAGPIAFFTLSSQTMQVSLRGAAQAHLVAMAVLLDRVFAALILGGTLVLGLSPADGLSTALCAGPVLSGLLAYKFTTPKDRPVWGTFRWRNPWRAATFYGISSVAVGSQSLDLPLMNIVGGPLAAGLYGAVNRWTTPMGLLAASFSAVSVPFVAGSKSWAQSWAYARKASWLLFAAVGSCVFVIVIAPWIVNIVVGSQYVGAVPVLRVLAFGTIPAIFNQPLATFLQARGHDRVVSAVTVGSVMLQLLAVAVLASKLGALGAADAFLGAQLAILVCLILVFRRVRHVVAA